MADTTTNYDLPFQLIGDAPDGPDLGQGLAEAVDAELTLLNAKPIITGAACSAPLDLTTAEADVAGATVTVATTKPNARYVAHGSFYMSAATGGSAVASGKLMVDGVAQAAKANFTGPNTLDRASVAQTWRGTLAAAGNHTLKLRGVASAVGAGNGAFRINTGDTTITVEVFES
ncbi:MAG TPA: hypothetical protein VIQ30_26050 [Pseudonocardia sp.]